VTGSPDVVVIGGGLVGLASALGAAGHGLRVTVLEAGRVGAASTAGAGMLAPGVERADGPAHALAITGRDRFPSYLAWLAEASGIRVPLSRDGVLELVPDDAAAATRAVRRPAGATWLSPTELAALDPAYAAGTGALLHPDDGAVDTEALLAALRAAAARAPLVSVEAAAVARVVPERGQVAADDGRSWSAATIVLAAGAWAAGIDGLAWTPPVTPIRGQMLSYAWPTDRPGPRHVAYGAGGYVVPRPNGGVWVGATMESAGFDASVTPDGAASLAGTATRLLPALAQAVPMRHWAGLRPISPDLLPIVGIHPEVPRVLFATGHSRNGILLAPLTGDVIGALAAGTPPPVDPTPWSPMRFDNRQN
jgi:glycine oxidase